MSFTTKPSVMKEPAARLKLPTAALRLYKAGVGNILDLLNAQSALAAARLQRIQAALDWYVARASLARSIGTLDGSLLDPTTLAPPTESLR